MSDCEELRDILSRAEPIRDSIGLLHGPGAIWTKSRYDHRPGYDLTMPIPGGGWETFRISSIDWLRQQCAACGGHWIVDDDLKLIHLPTQAAIQAAEAGPEWQAAEECFVRFGDLPTSGRSRNYASGEYDAGVSVFAGRKIGHRVRIVLNNNQLLGTFMFDLRGRKAYIVEGRCVGVGSDGEPILQDAKIVAEAQFEGIL